MGSDLCVLAMTYVCWPVTSSDTLIFGDFYLWGEVHEFRGVGRESKIFAIFLTFLSVTFFFELLRNCVDESLQQGQTAW
jgi:hypothetical protein